MPTLLLLAEMGWQNVTEADGLAISITGMLIVFVALIGISLFIGLLPMLLARIEPWLPEGEGHHAPAHAAGATPADDPRIIAAIGYAKHLQSRGGGPS